MTKAEAQAAIAKYGSQTKAAAGLGVSRSMLRRRLAGGGESKTAAPKQDAPKAVPIPAKPGHTLADFRRTYDKDTIIPNKIKTALKALGGSWEYEREFVARSGVSYADLGHYREMFAENLVTIKRDSKRVWAGTTGLAAQLREMV